MLVLEVAHEPGPLQRHGGMRGEGHQQLLIVVVERAPFEFVQDLDDSEVLSENPQGDTDYGSGVEAGFFISGGVEAGVLVGVGDEYGLALFES